MKLFDLMYAGRSLGVHASAIGSAILASILYQTSLGDFIYKTDANGNAILGNQGFTGPLYDGLLNTGRALELGTTNDLAIPIHYTLGSEQNPNPDFTTDLTGWTYDSLHYRWDPLGILEKYGTGEGQAAYFTSSSAIGDLIRIEFNVTEVALAPAVVIDGSVMSFTQPVDKSSNFVDANGNLSFQSVGVYWIEFVATAANHTLGVTGNLATFKIDYYYVKQITNPNSFLTYYDFTKSKLVTLGNSVDGGSSEELNAYDGTYDVLDAGWIDNGDGTFSCDGTSGFIRFGSIRVAGKTYYSSIEVISISSGQVTNFYDGSGSMPYDTVGIKTWTEVNSASVAYIYSVGFVGTIRPISTSEILPTSTTYTLNNQTVNNILTHSTEPSDSDRAKLNTNPQLMAKLALSGTGSIDELDMTLTASDKWFACGENEGAYVVDARAGYGSELYTGFTTIGTGWTDNLDNTYSCDGTQTAVTTISQIASLSLDSKYLCEFTISGYVAGNARFKLLGVAWISSGWFSGNGTYTAILDNTVANTLIAVDGDASFIGTVSGVSFREATAEEITNYASTIRTNVDLNPKGLQTTSLVLDGAGVPSAYGDETLLQFNDDGRYVNTQWIPNNNIVSIECVFDVPATITKNNFNGADSDLRRMGFLSTGQLGMRWGSGQKYTLVSSGLYHVIGIYDGVNIEVYINGVSQGQSATTLSTCIHPFFLGETSDSAGNPNPNVSLESYMGIFKVHHNKVLTATEVTDAYTKAKAIYPTLP